MQQRKQYAPNESNCLRCEILKERRGLIRWKSGSKLHHTGQLMKGQRTNVWEISSVPRVTSN